MGEIDMLGGSDLHMDRGKEDAASQTGGSEGEIMMLGGSDLHMSHSPIGTEQKGGKGSGIDFVGMQGLIDRNAKDRPYGEKKPTDHGME